MFCFSDKLNLMCLSDIEAKAESGAQRYGRTEGIDLGVTGNRWYLKPVALGYLAEKLPKVHNQANLKITALGQALTQWTGIFVPI